MDEGDDILAFATGDAGSAALSAEQRSVAQAIDNFDMTSVIEDQATANLPTAAVDPGLDNQPDAGEDNEPDPENNNGGPVPLLAHTCTQQEKEDIAQAKSMMIFMPRDHKRNRKDRSWVWTHFKKVRLDPARIPDLRRLDARAAATMLSATDVESCNICYENEEVSLGISLRASGGQSTNLVKHMKQFHPLLVPQKPAKKRGNSFTDSTALSSKRSRNASPTFESVDEGSVTASESRKPPVPSSINARIRPSSIDAMLHKGSDNFIDEFHELWVDFGTNNNLAVRTVTDKTACPELFKLLQYAMDHGSALRNHPRRMLGKDRYTRIRKDKYECLLSGFGFFVARARAFWAQYCKKRIPFIIVGHDIWDSTSHEILGNVALFPDPIDMDIKVYSTGLDRIDNKKAAPTAEKTLERLALCGIEKEDIFRSVNDTTNSAVKTGFLLAGERGTCFMHLTQLVLKHAIGKLTRSKNGVVQDKFPEMDTLRSKVEKASSWLMDKKAKGRYKNYEKHMLAAKRTARKIIQPNSTRAGGIVLHDGDMIAARFNLSLEYDLIGEKVNCHALTDMDFEQLAQVYAVTYPILVLILALQSDRAGCLAYTFMHTFRTLVSYHTAEYWWVADVTLTSNITNATRWDGNAKWPKRDHMGCPTLPVDQENLNKENGNVKWTGNKKTITLVKISTDELFKVTTTCLRRLKTELRGYCGKPSKDQLLAMAVNPFIVSWGFQELECQAEILKEVAEDEEDKELAIDFRLEAKKILVEAVRELCSELVGETVSGGDESNNDVVDNNNDSLITKMRKKKLREARAKANVAVSDDPIEKAVDDFFALKFQVKTAMVAQAKETKTKIGPGVFEKIGNTEEEWMQNWEAVSLNFDCVNWWFKTGQHLYPLIFPVAVIILAMPDSNGLQERTFSTSTWMDGKLNKRQSEFTFSSKVLLYKNQGILEQFKATVKEAMRQELKEQAAARTMRALKVSAMLRGVDDEEDLDEETELMMDAYLEDTREKEEIAAAKRAALAAAQAAAQAASPEETEED